MAGLYIHVPFCRKACHYCDFHFSTSSKMMDEMVHAISSEIEQRSSELEDTVKTIYFGGGTPSLLDKNHIHEILNAAFKSFSIATDAEVTLEANPEDINSETLNSWRSLGINRLSIGLQSLNDEILLWMNRAHNSKEAVNSVCQAIDFGFTNVSVDLIYGVKKRSESQWLNEVNQVLEMGVPHLSAYCLTIEPQTVFGKKKNKGLMSEAPDEQTTQEFLKLIDTSKQFGVELYEVSNFSKTGLESKHNSNYWNGASYIGVGPSAHSFNKNTRSWNIANNALYVKSIGSGSRSFELENLSLKDQFNEYIMTNLRRREGINLELIKSRYGTDLDFNEVRGLVQKNQAHMVGQNLKLSSQGMLMADAIASAFFWV